MHSLFLKSIIFVKYNRIFFNTSTKVVSPHINVFSLILRVCSFVTVLQYLKLYTLLKIKVNN